MMNIGLICLYCILSGRVRVGSHFTWRGSVAAVTVLPPSVTGAAAQPARPYAATAAWLQVSTNLLLYIATAQHPKHNKT